MIYYYIYPKITLLTRDVAIFDFTIEFSQKYAPCHANATLRKKKNSVHVESALHLILSKDDPYFNFLVLHALTCLEDECIHSLEELEWL